MIVAETSCSFMIKAEGEAAGSVMSEISPSTATDIAVVTLISADFESDILALNNMDKSIAHFCALVGGKDLTLKEELNPLYLPGPMAAIDDMLSINAYNDHLRFTGMDGNPYTLKTVEVSAADTHLLSARAAYKPFDFPNYADIVKTQETTLLN